MIERNDRTAPSFFFVQNSSQMQYEAAHLQHRDVNADVIKSY